MNIYQIDEETGEIKDFEQFEKLQLARDAKIENIGRMYKNYKLESFAIRAEEAVLLTRRKQCERNMQKLKELLDYALGGEKYKSASVVVSYRKSSAVEIDEDNFINWAKENARQYLRYNEPEINKIALGDDLRSGIDVPYAAIIENKIMSTK